EPRAREWFEQSARRFRRSHYGAAFTAALERLARRGARQGAAGGGTPGVGGRGTARTGGGGGAPPPPRGGRAAGEGAGAGGAGGPVWVEVWPNPHGFPAAAERVLVGPDAAPVRWSLPAEVVATLPKGTRLWVRVADERGRELACYTLDCPPAPEPAPEKVAG